CPFPPPNSTSPPCRRSASIWMERSSSRTPFTIPPSPSPATTHARSSRFPAGYYTAKLPSNAISPTRYSSISSISPTTANSSNTSSSSAPPADPSTSPPPPTPTLPTASPPTSASLPAFSPPTASSTSPAKTNSPP